MRYYVPSLVVTLVILLITSNFHLCASDSLLANSTTALDPDFNIEQATQEYLDTLSPEQKEQSDNYFEGGYWLILWNVIYDIIVGYIFLALGLSHWIRKFVTRFKNVNIHNFIYSSFYLLLAYVLAFPLNIYESYFREHQYDLSNLAFGEWMGEELIGLAILIPIGSLFFMLLYMAIRKVGQSWWIWGGGLTFIFLIIGMYLAPVFISPLFNDYSYLEEGKVRQEILSMARANIVPADNVYQFDASEQSNRISANVSGIGSSIRVSLNDNLLNRCTTEEVKAVMGHELGHYVLNHVYKSLLSFGLLMFLAFAFVNWGFQWVLRSFGSNWSIENISEIHGLPIIMVLFSIYFFFATPVTNNLIRINEVEADIFGLNAAREPDGFASVAMKLSEYRKIEPGYWEEIIFFDHPSGKTRVSTAMKWKAENLPHKDLHPMSIELNKDKQEQGE